MHALSIACIRIQLGVDKQDIQQPPLSGWFSEKVIVNVATNDILPYLLPIGFILSEGIPWRLHYVSQLSHDLPVELN